MTALGKAEALQPQTGKRRIRGKTSVTRFMLPQAQLDSSGFSLRCVIAGPSNEPPPTGAVPGKIVASDFTLPELQDRVLPQVMQLVSGTTK